MGQFADTTLGKTLKVLVWVVISGAVNALIAWFANNPDLFNPYVLGIINVILVAIKNLVDPNVKNL